MMRIGTIAANTFIEVIRQPVYLIILGCSIFLILFSPYYTMFALLANNKMVKDMGLSTLLLTGLLLSAFSASNVIYREIENRTVFIVLTKPVTRATFIIGKYLGLLAALITAEYLLTLVLTHVVRTRITEAMQSKTDYPVLIGYLFALIFTLLMAAFANFFYSKPFTSSAIIFAIPIFSLVFLVLCIVSNEWTLQSFGESVDTNILLAATLIIMATALLMGIATASSTRFGPIFTLCFCSTIFLLGLFSDYVFGRFIESSLIAKICYMVIPNLQIYWVGDAIVAKRDIPLEYFYNIVIYTLLFICAILLFGIALFQERETK